MFKHLHRQTFNNWISAWIELAEAVVKIVTFALCLPTWSFKYSAWTTKRDILRSMK